MMKSLLSLCVALILTGCGTELLTTTAIQGEAQAEQAKAMKRQLETVTNQTGKIRIERAIALFQAEKGAYPPSLASLVPDYLPELPVKSDGTPYAYNPRTGKIMNGPASGTGPN